MDMICTIEKFYNYNLEIYRIDIFKIYTIVATALCTRAAALLQRRQCAAVLARHAS